MLNVAAKPLWLHHFKSEKLHLSLMLSLDWAVFLSSYSVQESEVDIQENSGTGWGVVRIK